MLDDEFLTSLATGARLLAGWACAAVAVLDLSMGVSLRDGPYLLFHVVLLAGGVLLLALDHAPKKPRPLAYVVTAVAAVILTLVSALPGTKDVCCMRFFDTRHGFPLTLVAWNPGERHHFAPAHAFADWVFWYFAVMIVLLAVTLVLPDRRAAKISRPVRAHHHKHGAHAEERNAPAAAPASDSATPSPEGTAAAPDDENVGGLP